VLHWESIAEEDAAKGDTSLLPDNSTPRVGRWVAHPSATVPAMDETLLDPEATEAAKREGMARSEQDRERHKRLLDEAIRSTADKCLNFTADQVWTELGDIPQHKGLASAMGPALVRAAKNGIVTSTQEFRACERPVSHGNMIRVWQSLVATKPRGVVPTCFHIEHAVRPETGRVGRIDQFPYLRWEPCPERPPLPEIGSDIIAISLSNLSVPQWEAARDEVLDACLAVVDGVIPHLEHSHLRLAEHIREQIETLHTWDGSHD